MPAWTRLQREREKRAAESPDVREIRLQRRRLRRAASYASRPLPRSRLPHNALNSHSNIVRKYRDLTRAA